MQFLDILNQMLRHDKQTSSRSLSARKYAVIPLSERSGLIQWVEHATPLFALYKHWQRREVAAHQALAKEPGTVPRESLRPSDIFYGKIIPALKAKGITNVMSRKDWPKEVLRAVFLELESETPKYASASAGFSPTQKSHQPTTVGAERNERRMVGEDPEIHEVCGAHFGDWIRHRTR
jgi:serine/threonine-protein kinase SMG1